MKPQEKNASISLKVTFEEKERLKNKAAALNLSTSDYIRIKSLSEHEEMTSLTAQNRELRSKNKELEVLNSIGIPRYNQESLAIPCTEHQQELLRKLYGGINDDQSSLGSELLRILIETAIKPQWQFDLGTRLEIGKDFILQGNIAHLCLKNRNTYVQEQNISSQEIVEAFEDLISPAMVNFLEDIQL